MEESKILYQGKTLIYPTDTIWGIGCNALNITAIDKIKQIKGRDKTKSFILLIKNLQMLEKYVENVPAIALRLINEIKTPLTIIYPKAKNLPIEHLSFNESIGIRIPKDDFLQHLFEEFPYPIVSTSANFSGKESPKCFADIDKDLLNKVDYVSFFNRDKINSSASSIYIIDNDNNAKKIR